MVYIDYFDDNGVEYLDSGGDSPILGLVSERFVSSKTSIPPTLELLGRTMNMG